MTTQHRRARQGLALVLGAGLLALTACSPASPDSQPDGTPVTGGTLVYASGDAEPTCLDPHVGGNYPQALLASQFLEPLVTLDDGGNIVPWLASAWETSEDGLTLTLTIRSDVTFTDGTALTADAVRRNLEHLRDPATASSTGYLALERIVGMRSSDEHTLVLSLSAPDSSLLESLSQPWLAIESPAGLARSQEENCAAPIGTGPFIVSEWKRQESISLVRNENYTTAPKTSSNPGAAYLDGITWRFIPDSATRYAALTSGQVDIIDNAQPDAIAAAQDEKTIAHLDAPRPGSVNRIELNSGKAPFDDVRVREAFIRSVDLSQGIKGLFFGTAERSTSPLSSVERFAISESDPFTTDTAAASALLDEAGWNERDGQGYRIRDGKRLSLNFPVSTNQSIPAEISLFEQIQAQAKTAGFEVTLAPLDLSSWYGALGENSYNLVSAPYTKVGADVLRILYHSDGITPAPSGYFANHAQVNDPELDDLLTRASESSDDGERADLYAQAQKIILDGFYILPLYDQQNHFLYRNEVGGIGDLSSVATPLLGSAWLAK